MLKERKWNKNAQTFEKLWISNFQNKWGITPEVQMKQILQADLLLPWFSVHIKTSWLVTSLSGIT